MRLVRGGCKGNRRTEGGFGAFDDTHAIPLDTIVLIVIVQIKQLELEVHHGEEKDRHLCGAGLRTGVGALVRRRVPDGQRRRSRHIDAARHRCRHVRARDRGCPHAPHHEGRLQGRVDQAARLQEDLALLRARMVRPARARPRRCRAVLPDQSRRLRPLDELRHPGYARAGGGDGRRDEHRR